MESFCHVAMTAWVVYRKLGLNGADRLAFATCETHCETFVKNDEYCALNKPCCIIGVWLLKPGLFKLLSSLRKPLVTICANGAKSNFLTAPRVQT